MASMQYAAREIGIRKGILMRTKQNLIWHAIDNLKTQPRWTTEALPEHLGNMSKEYLSGSDNVIDSINRLDGNLLFSRDVLSLRRPDASRVVILN